MFDSQSVIALVIPIVAITGWALYAIVAVVMRARVRELEVRERIAMIEKGMVPPPERDPGAFEKAVGATELEPTRDYRQYRAYKHRSAGITMVAVGLGLWVMMYPNFRVGGFLVVVGLGFIVSGLFERPPRPGQF
jgi:uncharacterized protein DUF6249